MHFSDFLSPAFSEPPCGPDLDLAGDNEYYNYVIPAEGRLPDHFIEPETGRMFDRNSIDLERESSQIRSLLSRSRDARLIVLQAQFCAVAGDLTGFGDCVAVLDGALRQYWNDLHPVPIDGDLTARKVAIEGLSDRAKVIAPLTYMPIVKDRSLGGVSLRHWRVANRPELARSGETLLDPAVIRSAALAGEANQLDLRSFHERVKVCHSHLRGICAQFDANDASEFVPVMGVLDLFAELAAFAEGLLPQPIVAAAKDARSAIDDGVGAGANVSAVAQHFPITSSSLATKAITVTPVENQREAKDALSAIESYFVQSEPSSPALLLVHQARLLIGMPIIEALAALAPGRVETARLVIDQASGFSLDMEKMRQLSVAKGNDEKGGLFGRSSGREYGITTREGALGLMLGVEQFLSRSEPSSPVPLLLSRAREFMEKNFSSIIMEMFEGGEQKK